MDKNALFRKFVAFTTAVHQATSEMTRNVKADDITPLQYSILEYLAVSQPVTLSQISECMHMSMPNTSRELRKLAERQLCEKFAVAEDRRKQYIRLSEKGQMMMDEAFQRIESRFLQRIGDIAEEDLQEIEQALDLLQAKVLFP